MHTSRFLKIFDFFSYKMTILGENFLNSNVKVKLSVSYIGQCKTVQGDESTSYPSETYPK